ncbi:unnamed protein product, partial [Mesorhabditis belari]|uniref:UBX domain-containing protein n=1 Tax=Mesorhabditis belari TaxID=2138241 RepID=A0AAF3ELH0_9BILA
MSKRRFDDTVDNGISNPWERKRFRALEKRLQGLRIDPLDASNVASTSQASGDSPSPERRLSIALRYPDGKRQIAELEVDTKVERLFQIIHAHGVSPSMVVLIKQFPKTVISLEDSQKTLAELGITTSEALFVEEK